MAAGKHRQRRAHLGLRVGGALHEDATHAAAHARYFLSVGQRRDRERCGDEPSDLTFVQLFVQWRVNRTSGDLQADFLSEFGDADRLGQGSRKCDGADIAERREVGVGEQGASECRQSGIRSYELD